MKVSRLSRSVKGALKRNMPNVTDNFVTCTDGFYGGLKVSESDMETRLDLQMLWNHRQWWRIFDKNSHTFNWSASDT